jgi:hypothetical protein
MVLLYFNMIVVGHQMSSILAVLSSFMLLLIGSLVIFTMSHSTAVCIIIFNYWSILCFSLFFQGASSGNDFCRKFTDLFLMNRIESEYFHRCRISCNHGFQLLAIRHLESSSVKYHNNNNNCTYHSYCND